jgi:hypothetical protein
MFRGAGGDRVCRVYRSRHVCVDRLSLHAPSLQADAGGGMDELFMEFARHGGWRGAQRCGAETWCGRPHP